jgi:FAD/FMN-containing dehydrogenase
MSLSMQPATTRLVHDLARAIEGRVIVAGDSAYDQARQIYPGGIDRHPAAIVRAANANDVAHVVTIVGGTGVELAVRSGGHSPAGHGTTEGGVVLDMRDMGALDVDVERRSAWAQTGLTAGAYSATVAEHGLATGFGDTGSVGIGGITLVGGVGFLVRKYGLTIDNLLGAEIVTADGQLVRADAESHPDLFWALRGGGGNFGVVTRFHYRLLELQQIVAGVLLLPATPDVIASFLAEADAAPDELSTIANIMPAPPAPFVPEDVQGQLVVMGLMAYAGAPGDAERVLAPFRALASPIADLVRPMSYPEVLLPTEEDYHPVYASRTMFVDAFDDSSIASILEHLETSDAPLRVAQLRVLGGAIARVPAAATAFAHRDRRFMVNVAAVYERPERAAEYEAWVDGFAASLRRGGPGAYAGFLGDEGVARVREAYPGATWDRLAEVKRRYDPGNLFHLNQNVPPS